MTDPLPSCHQSSSHSSPRCFLRAPPPSSSVPPSSVFLLPAHLSSFDVSSVSAFPCSHTYLVFFSRGAACLLLVGLIIHSGRASAGRIRSSPSVFFPTSFLLLLKMKLKSPAPTRALTYKPKHCSARWHTARLTQQQQQRAAPRRMKERNLSSHF